VHFCGKSGEDSTDVFYLQDEIIYAEYASFYLCQKKRSPARSNTMATVGQQDGHTPDVSFSQAKSEARASNRNENLSLRLAETINTATQQEKEHERNPHYCPSRRY